MPHRAALLSVGSLAALVLGLPPAPVRAAAAGNSAFDVNVLVNATCTFSTTNMAFGAYVGAQLDAAGTVIVTCTNSTPFSVGINAGINNSGQNWGWQLAGPAGARLSYKVFKDAERTTYWGGNPYNDAVDGTGNGNAQVLTAYGRVLADQGVTPGAYSDTIQFTLYF